jgi:large subunit ribosomal protein L25
MKIEINANKRELQGSGASRRLRRTGRVPGIVYGGGEDATAIDLDHNELFHALRNEAFHASVLTMILDGKKVQVLLRDTQMHAFKPLVEHVDFQRINPKEKIHMKVPFHFVNADVAPGVKLAHSTVTHIMTEADVACLPKDLPEFIEVDLGNLQAGHSVHLSELKLPKGVEFVDVVHGNDKGVATIPVPRGGLGEAGEAAAE